MPKTSKKPTRPVEERLELCTSVPEAIELLDREVSKLWVAAKKQPGRAAEKTKKRIDDLIDTRCCLRVMERLDD